MLVSLPVIWEQISSRTLKEKQTELHRKVENISQQQDSKVEKLRRDQVLWDMKQN